MITHIVAPDGEVIIVLREPNAPLAPLPTDPPKAQPPTSKTATGADAASPKSPTDQPIEAKLAETQTPVDEVRYRVSAQHLILASPVFKKALCGKWKEAKTLKETGTVEVYTLGWDTEAFLILMRIFHCKPQELPKQGSLELIAKIAVLADYYECMSLVQFYIEPWVPKQITGDFRNDPRLFMIVLWISWAFSQSTRFNICSSYIMRFSKGPITSLGLPIPAKIIDKLNEGRETALKDAITAMDVKRNALLNDKSLCTVTCRSVTIGALLIFLAERNLLAVCAPYNNTGLNEYSIPSRPSRDGHIDTTGPSDIANKAIWSASQGAIFLTNIRDATGRCPTSNPEGNLLSDTELASCNDTSGNIRLTLEYLAPLRSVPMDGISDEVGGFVYATPDAAYERVRLFVRDDENSTEWTLVDRRSQFGASELRKGLVLGLDSRELVTDSNVWDGNVLVRFDVFDGDDVGSDAVALKLAPVLTHHHLEQVETLVSVSGNGSAMARFLSDLDKGRQQAGLEQLLFLFNQSDICAQGFFEPAYASMPGQQVFNTLRGKGIGAFQPSPVL
ncbi:hypothetical protein BJX70DRAFT_394548 [Aspergillus crustosus]